MANDELPEIKLDTDNLYLEESFTDRRAGILRRMTPVMRDGTPDPRRPTLFVGQTQLMTQMGALPISFEIDAKSLDEALEKFPVAARQGVEETLEELQQLRREAASSIVIPQGGGPDMGGPGGMGPGGKIQLR